jgi:hypothetical protein
VKTYLTALGVDIWYSVVNGYVIPKNAPTDPNKMTMDELHGSLIAYEMRTSTESDQPNNEQAFKSINKTKDKDSDLDE